MEWFAARGAALHPVMSRRPARQGAQAMRKKVREGKDDDVNFLEFILSTGIERDL
jgi:hypothetical protein